MTRRVLLCVMVLAVSVVAAQEIAVPVTPVVRTVTSFQIIGFSQERYPQWRFTITWRDSNGDVFSDVHFGPTSMPSPDGPIIRPDGADSFIKQMNTANFSTVSFERRLIEHLEKHGTIPAYTISGTPEK
jgi:hypothetical protein